MLLREETVTRIQFAKVCVVVIYKNSSISGMILSNLWRKKYVHYFHHMQKQFPMLLALNQQQLVVKFVQEASFVMLKKQHITYDSYIEGFELTILPEGVSLGVQCLQRNHSRFILYFHVTIIKILKTAIKL